MKSFKSDYKFDILMMFMFLGLSIWSYIDGNMIQYAVNTILTFIVLAQLNIKLHLDAMRTEIQLSALKELSERLKGK